MNISKYLVCVNEELDNLSLYKSYKVVTFLESRGLYSSEVYRILIVGDNGRLSQYLFSDVELKHNLIPLEEYRSGKLKKILDQNG